MKRRGIIAMIIATMVIMNVLVMLSSQQSHLNSSAGNENNYPKPVLKASSHKPIYIYGDSYLTPENGVEYDSHTGNYYIHGYAIDANGSYGIYVANINKTLIIEYCDVYNGSSGIRIDNIIGTGYVEVYQSYVHDTSSAAIYITNSGQYGGRIWIEKSNIFGADRAGIYAGTVENISVEENVIFQNDVGIHYSSVKHGQIINNGIGENTQEGIRIQSSSYVTIFDNKLYHNRGSGDKFDINHVQATEYSSSWIDWDNGYGNYWHDWAMNNESNWYYESNGIYTMAKLKWKYPIADFYGNVVNHDNYPDKVIHVQGEHAQNATVTFEMRLDRPTNITGKYGVVAGLGTQSNPYKIVGVMYNLTGEKHGIRFDLYGYYAEFINVWAFNSSGGTGHGFEIETGYVTLKHVNVYNCSFAGVYADYEGYGDAGIYNSYIHNNGYGVIVLDQQIGYLTIFKSTITDNTFDGIYANTSAIIEVKYSVIGYNGYNFLFNGTGIYIDPYYWPDVYVSNTSFFKNKGYGIMVGDSDGTRQAELQMHNNIFHGNNGATENYNIHHIQVYIGSNNGVLVDDVRGNFYNDYINYRPKMWYDFSGSDLYDDKPLYWVDYTGPGIHVNRDINTYYLYNGTEHGIIGMEEGFLETYWIEGWNVLNSYDYTGMKLSNFNAFLEIKWCNVSNIYGAGIVLSDLPLNVWIDSNTIAHNDLEGISAVNVPYISIVSNEIFDNDNDGIYINGGNPHIHHNKIYRNTNGYNAYGIEIRNIKSTSSTATVEIYNNQIFSNDEGIYIYNVSVANGEIIHNGIVYNANYGIHVVDSNGLLINNNSFYMNHGSHASFNSANVQAYDNGNNMWNDSNYGNYWHDWAMNNDTNDNNYDWIIDWPYPIDGSAKDNLPVVYFDHEPLNVSNYKKLTYDYGVLGGDGSWQYPYVIAGWMFGLSNSGYGIRLNSLSGYLTIDHCLIVNAKKDVWGNGSGIIVTGFYESNAYESRLLINNTDSSYNEVTGLRLEYAGSDLGYIGYDYVWITNSRFTNNGYYGMILYDSHAKLDTVNISYNNRGGIYASDDSDLMVENSEIYKNGNSTNHGAGVLIIDSSGPLGYNNEIHDNIIKENYGYGIEIRGTTYGYTIYRNQFIGNNGASEDGNYDSAHIQAYDETQKYNNTWNTTSEGNCWSDYTGSGAYLIAGGNSADEHPGCGFVPEINPTYIVFMLVAIFAGIVVRRKHK